MPDVHLGIFVTLSAYANRLHGDERGTVDRANNAYGTPTLAPSNARRGYERNLQAFPAMTFGAGHRAAIEAAVAESCAFKGWELVACHCRTNHLHAVILTAAARTEAIARLKTRSTMALEASGLIERGRPVWARGGSGRYLWSEADVEAATGYAMEAQGAPLPGTGLWRREGAE
jgi:REP element-mobilizing transposase RayT